MTRDELAARHPHETVAQDPDPRCTICHGKGEHSDFAQYGSVLCSCAAMESPHSNETRIFGGLAHAAIVEAVASGFVEMVPPEERNEGRFRLTEAGEAERQATEEFAEPSWGPADLKRLADDDPDQRISLDARDERAQEKAPTETTRLQVELTQQIRDLIEASDWVRHCRRAGQAYGSGVILSSRAGAGDVEVVNMTNGDAEGIMQGVTRMGREILSQAVAQGGPDHEGAVH